MAGPGGFEPSFSGLEVRCLILTWPRAPSQEYQHPVNKSYRDSAAYFLRMPSTITRRRPWRDGGSQLALARDDHVLLEQLQVLVEGGGVPVDEVGETLQHRVVAPLVGEDVAEDGLHPVVLHLFHHVLQALDHLILDPCVLPDGLVELDGGRHVGVQGHRGCTGFDVDEGLAEGGVLPAVVDDGLEEGGDQPVADGLDGGFQLLDVAQLKGLLLPQELD